MHIIEIDLISAINDKSSFVRYSLLKITFIEKKQSCYLGVKRVHSFLKRINSKMNVEVRLEGDFVVQYFNHEVSVLPNIFQTRHHGNKAGAV